MLAVTPFQAVLASALFVLLVVQWISWRRKIKVLPPGPPKLPLIGNWHNMPNGYDWVKFREIAKRYNTDIIHLYALDSSIVVLSSHEAAKDLFAIRSGIYSDRSVSVMANELADMGKIVTLMPYGEDFRTCRRVFAKHFGPEDIKHNAPRELFYARRCLSQLLKTPDDIQKHLRYLIGSISLSITYGLKARAENDEYIDLSQKFIQFVLDIVAAGVYLVDMIPILKYLPAWFPGAEFQRTAAECKRQINDTRESLFKIATSTMETSEYTPSFVSKVLEAKTKVDLPLVKDIALTMYGAASDTTWAALTVFTLAMVQHPESQKKLQHELDAVLNGRLPTHADVLNLPYLNAVWMEVMRWKPVAPINTPHVCTMTDNYRDYVIPAGSIVIANQWAMLQDPDVYPNPTEFRPERFLKDGKIDTSVLNPLEMAFGFGRRICPGRHVAQTTFMITAASIISSFDLLMKKDENGLDIWPDPEFVSSTVCHPKDFPCNIVPRSDDARRVISDWVTAEGDSPP